MKPVPFAEGEKNSWLNYKTGEKHITFKTDADHQQATIAITISHKDKKVLSSYYGQFEALKSMFELSIGESWIWQPPGSESETGKIFTSLNPVNIYKKEDWPTLISFFKPRLIAFDTFWMDAKSVFESLR